MRRLLFVCFVVIAHVGVAQNSVRQQIDKDRDGAFQDDKTYKKALRFIRMDSTYYLGYMLEGAYLFFRANDEMGFAKAIVPLQKALDKIEHDFDPLLRIRTNNYSLYGANYRYQYDYGLITYFLCHSYQNLEDQEKAMTVARHLRDRNFQMEINMDSYNTMAWIFHRNRVYTSKQFSFLKNSVKENVYAANRYLDSAVQKIQNNMPYNNGLYDPKLLNRQYLTTYHYKAMIHDYLLDIDSANYYYNLLLENDAYSSNNYAEFKLAMGEMREAELFFREAAERERNIEKTTKEYYYMLGTLAIYQGRPAKADTLLTNVLQEQGSTPGFGWHCIGLARAQHFEGLTAESQARANKAAHFQELHISTTWGKEQYNLTVAALNYLNQLQLKKEYWFEHNEWYFWFNPLNWFRWLKYAIEIRQQKLIVATLVADNPERDQVIYPIFSPENLMSFDEVWSIIDGLGNNYFIDYYKKRLQTDKRPHVKNYFRYFLGKLSLAEGNKDDAINYFQQVLNDGSSGDPYQTLLMARACEGLALASGGNDRKKFTQEFYLRYPQLVPFSELTMAFQLRVQGQLTEAEQNIVDELKNSKINFSDDPTLPVVMLSFHTQPDAVHVNFSVQLGNRVLQNGAIRIENNDVQNAGKLIAYHLFGIQKVKIGEQPSAAPQKMKAEKKPV